MALGTNRPSGADQTHRALHREPVRLSTPLRPYLRQVSKGLQYRLHPQPLRRPPRHTTPRKSETPGPEDRHPHPAHLDDGLEVERAELKDEVERAGAEEDLEQSDHRRKLGAVPLCRPVAAAQLLDGNRLARLPMQCAAHHAERALAHHAEHLVVLGGPASPSAHVSACARE
eukprot:953403-Pleurochrysis_carterae.AAC.4